MSVHRSHLSSPRQRRRRACRRRPEGWWTCPARRCRRARAPDEGRGDGRGKEGGKERLKGNAEEETDLPHTSSHTHSTMCTTHRCRIAHPLAPPLTAAETASLEGGSSTCARKASTEQPPASAARSSLTCADPGADIELDLDMGGCEGSLRLLPQKQNYSYIWWRI